jgi:hypothetical protein
MEGESVRATGSFDDRLDGGFGCGGFKVWTTTVAAEGDEVELAGFVTTFEALGHGSSLSAWERKRFALGANAHSCGETA